MRISKANQKLQQQLAAQRQVQHFGLRKLSVGVVSVLLSTSLYFGATSVAHAANGTPSVNTETVPSGVPNQASTATLPEATANKAPVGDEVSVADQKTPSSAVDLKDARPVGDRGGAPVGDEVSVADQKTPSSAVDLKDARPVGDRGGAPVGDEVSVADQKTPSSAVDLKDARPSVNRRVALKALVTLPAGADTTSQYDVDDIYNYYHDKGSNVSKERIQRLVDYKNNLASVTAILKLDQTSYGSKWVDQALEKQIAIPKTFTNAYVDKIVGIFRQNLVKDTNQKIDTQLVKLEALQKQYPNYPDVKKAIDELTNAKAMVTPDTILDANRMESVIETLNKYSSKDAYNRLEQGAQQNQALDEAKTKAQEALANLNNLTTDQKTAAKQAIEAATDSAAVSAAQDTATTLDNKMGALKQAVDQAKKVKDMGNYTNADTTAQQALNDALTNGEGITTSGNTAAGDVETAIGKLTEAMNGLNGDKKLADAKTKAQEALANLNNLTTDQKTAAKQAIEAATDSAAVSAAQDTATTLDNKMGALKQAVDQAKKVKDMGNYTNADTTAQQALNDALTNGEGITTSGNTAAGDVETAIGKLTEAMNGLNGDKKLADAKTKAQEALANLNNLTTDQKTAAKQAIEAATDSAAVSAAQDTATTLDNKMGALKQAVDQAKKVKDMGNYTNADTTAQQALNDALTNGEGITTSGNTAAGDVETAIGKLTEAMNGLNGDKKLADAKTKAQEALANLNNLTTDQKTAAKQAIEAATDSAAVSAAQDTATTLDNKMGALKQAVDQAKKVKDMGNYTNADTTAQQALNDALTNGEGITTSGNTAAGDVETAIGKLTEAMNGLNGDKKLADAKTKAQEALANLNNLTTDQKTAAKQAIEAATDSAAVSAAQDTATTLDNKMGALKQAVDQAKKVKDMGNYTNADTTAQQALNDALTNGEGITTSGNTAAGDVETAIGKLTEAMNGLNGDKKLADAKTKAQEALANLNNLTTDQKTAAKQAIEAATDSAAVSAAQDTATTLDNKMGALKQAVDQAKKVKDMGNYTNADTTAQQALNDALTNGEGITTSGNTAAGDVETAIGKLTEAMNGLNGDKKLADAKTKAQEALANLNNLTTDQKTAAKQAIEAATDSAAVSAAQDTATTLDNKMGALKQAVDQAKKVKDMGNYTNADTTAQQALNDALTNGEGITTSGNTAAGDVETAIGKLTEAMNGLNGDKKLADAKTKAQEALANLNNLTTDQKTAAKQAIEAATDSAAVSAAQDTATTLDNKMGALKQAVDQAKKVKDMGNYTNADTTAQQALNDALTNGEGITTSGNTAAGDVETAIGKLTEAMNGLNGDKKLADAKTKAQEALANLNNLTTDQKTAAKQAIEAATDSAAVSAAQDTATTLDNKMGALKQAVDQAKKVKDMGNYTNADTTAQQALNDALTNGEGITTSGNTAAGDVETAIGKLTEAMNGLNGDKKLADAKTKAQEALANLNNLTTDQKTAAKQAIEAATDSAAVSAAQDTATTLDNKMGALKQAVDQAKKVKDMGNYTNADTTAQQALNDALTNGEGITTSGNTAAGDVETAIGKLTEAMNGLNGDKKLADAKTKAQEALANLNNLTTDQKTAAKQAIEAATDSAAVSAAQDTATTLDNKMGALKQAVDQAKKVKDMGNYTNADTTAQQALNDALTNGEGITTSGNTAAGDVETAIGKLTEAMNGLNGDKKLADAKTKAQEALANLNNLTTDQKTAAKQAIEAATDSAAVSAAQDTATTLDNKMGALKQAVDQAKKVKDMGNYTNADTTAQQALNDALTNGEGITTSGNTAAGDVETAIGKLTEAMNGLNGDKKLADAKTKAQEALANLNNLTTDQKTAAKQAIEAATDSAAVSAAQDTATTLDNKMGALKQAVDQAKKVKDMGNYTNADTTAQQALNDALTNGEGITTSGNTAAGDVETAIGKLTEAMNGLNGDKKLADAKTKAQEALANLNNLTTDQKTAAKQAIEAATDSAAVSAAQDTATTLDNKMGALKQAVDQAKKVKDMGNYTNADTTAQQALNDALTNGEGITTSGNTAAGDVETAIGKLTEAMNGLNGDKKLADAKTKAQEALANLNNLTTDQKTAAKQAIEAATDSAAVSAAQDTATTLDNKMGALKQAVDQAKKVKDMGNYTNADTTAQQALNDALTNGEGITTSGNTAAGDVETAIGKLTEAMNGLNGDKKLADAKTKAQEALANLNNLTTDQKTAAKQAIEAATDSAAVSAAQDTATTLDNKMGALKQAVDQAKKVKDMGNYTNADTTAQQALNDALTNGEGITTSGNTAAGDVETAIGKLTEAMNGLNGDKKLADAKTKAQEALANLNNLTTDQKTAAKQAIEAATDSAAVSAAQDTATTLDNKMGALKQAVDQAKKVKDMGNYTNADTTAQQALNDALTNGEGITTSGNTAAGDVETAIGKLTEAMNKLNGDTKLAATKTAVKEVINGLTNLNQAQKEAALAQVEAATTVDEAKNYATTAITLDDTMGALQKAVTDGNNGKVADPKYYNADATTRAAYDKALSNAQAVLDDANATQAQIDQAKADLAQAAEALTGKATDKSALQATYNQANVAAKTTAYTNANDTIKRAYEKALSEAQAVLADANATQAQVDLAKAALDEIMALLKGASGDATVAKNSSGQNNKQALPQTGNTKNDAAVAGLGLAGLLAMLGLGGLKKKRN